MLQYVPEAQRPRPALGAESTGFYTQRCRLRRGKKTRGEAQVEVGTYLRALPLVNFWPKEDASTVSTVTQFSSHTQFSSSDF